MSKKSKIITAIIIVVLVVGAVGAYMFVKKDSNTTTTAKTSQQNPTLDVVGTINDYNDFSTLNKAIEAAGLTATLQGAGPYTVLAANDQAFDNLPEGTLDTLLKPENQAKLADILKYNIIPAEITTSQLTNGQLIKTLQGQEVKVEITDGSIYIIDAKGQKALIVNADLKATNGLLQEIDTLLFPQ